MSDKQRNYFGADPFIAKIPVRESNSLFHVRRVYCVGRNYTEHMREMGLDPAREEPFFFAKPGDEDCVVAVAAGTTMGIPYPAGTSNFQFEAELVVAIGAECRSQPPERATASIFGFATGLDMTRRDLQMEARKLGRPWEAGKSFDFSAPVGPLTPVEKCGLFSKGAIKLEVDGLTRQSSDISMMIWPVADIISKLSHLFFLRPGDLIFTGTPAGVGAVDRGELMQVSIEGLDSVSVRIL